MFWWPKLGNKGHQHPPTNRSLLVPSKVEGKVHQGRMRLTAQNMHLEIKVAKPMFWPVEKWKDQAQVATVLTYHPPW